MADDDLFDVQERIYKFNLSEIHTPEEWCSFFADGITLLEHPDDERKNYAIERMTTGIWSEVYQRNKQPEFMPLPAVQRIPPILDAIAKQDPSKFFILRFTVWGAFSADQQSVLSSWLTAAEAGGILSKDTVAVARIQADLYPTEDWNQAKFILEPLFDHPNALLRAAAAAGFGAMYIWDADNLPPLAATMKQVKAMEIERPGFAGSFLGQLLMDLGQDGEIEDSGVKLSDWILEIIAKRQVDEPCIPFYNGIDFHAHEVLSSNPEAVRKLMEFGAESVAAMTATEESHPIVGMQELLEELAFSPDDFVARICSWHLAYHYHFLHPEGHRRGYVQLEQRQGVDIFLVFDPAEHGDRPYAATIYPRDSALDDDLAWRWIDKLIPPHLRPPGKEDEPPNGIEEVKPESTSFVYGDYIIEMIGDCEKKQWGRVWIKWPLRSCEW